MRHFISISIITMLCVACNNPKSTKVADTISEGTINISAEKSFKPFMDEQLKVFASSFPKAIINVSYKSEIDCFKDFASDSTRMIFVTRGLNKQEEASYKDQLGFTPTFGVLAYNAIAIVLHKSAQDSMFTLKQISDKLKGIDPQQIVMDGNNLTGIIRFLKDSLVKQATFGKNVVAANGSDEVISYIKNHHNAIGFVGMNWIGDNYDPKQIAYRKDLKMGMIECTLCAEKGVFAQPSPSTISQGQYSLSLPVYYILKENAPGLGSGLLNFMSLERGQLIFKRALLVPAKMGFKNRNSILK